MIIVYDSDQLLFMAESVETDIKINVKVLIKLEKTERHPALSCKSRKKRPMGI